MKNESPASTTAKPASNSSSIPSTMTTGGGPLEPFILLSKTARGAAGASLIMQAISSPNIYVFGELLRSTNLQDLATKPETLPSWNLLQLFAYGTYGDYIKNRDQLPPLNESMILKLRQLTIVSFASVNKHIPYDRLLKELDVRNVRELEDLIIDAIYNGVIVGKLDQRNQQLEVDRCMGRDVRAEEIPSIVAMLTDWCDRCDALFAITEEQMNRANNAKLEAAEHKKKVETDFSNAKKAMKATGGAGTSAHGPDLDDFMGDVSSTAEPEKKKEKSAGRKGGLRGSAGKSWMKPN